MFIDSGHRCHPNSRHNVATPPKPHTSWYYWNLWIITNTQHTHCWYIYFHTTTDYVEADILCNGKLVVMYILDSFSSFSMSWWGKLLCFWWASSSLLLYHTSSHAFLSLFFCFFVFISSCPRSPRSVSRGSRPLTVGLHTLYNQSLTRAGENSVRGVRGRGEAEG